MIAEFSIVPIGTGTSLSAYVAECIGIVKRSGLKYQLTPMGTVLEGDADRVIPVIMECHEKVLQMSDRVITNIKIDDRRDRPLHMEQKVESVMKKMGKG